MSVITREEMLAEKEAATAQPDAALLQLCTFSVADMFFGVDILSVEEAVQLVLQASTLATGGEVFTLDMGEPVRIIDLARRLIHLSGRVPNRDVEVMVIGPRPGEKVVEELIGPGEQFVPSAHSGIAVSWPAAYERPLLKAAIHQLEVLAEDGSPEALAARMRDFVGEQLEQPMSVGSAG